MLDSDAQYETLVDWARACHAAGRILPRLAVLESNRIERWFDHPRLTELAPMRQAVRRAR
jgi:hypothetical protein